MEDRLARQADVQLPDIGFELRQAGGPVEPRSAFKLPAEMRIDVDARVSHGSKGANQVLRPLNARMPVGHRKEKQHGKLRRGLGERQWRRELAVGILPAVPKACRSAIRMKWEVQPPEV